jgi:hypothetical protein
MQLKTVIVTVCKLFIADIGEVSIVIRCDATVMTMCIAENVGLKWDACSMTRAKSCLYVVHQRLDLRNISSRRWSITTSHIIIPGCILQFLSVCLHLQCKNRLRRAMGRGINIQAIESFLNS